LGPSIALEELLTKPKNSLVNQSFDPEYHHLLQLGGSGLASWDKHSPHGGEPLLYKGAKPTFYDRNLASLCRSVRSDNLLAHIRATGYSDRASIHDENCHPFLYRGFKLAMAHNGALPGWRSMLKDILAACKPEVVAHLSGSTDTEPMYCLLMSQFDDPSADLDVDEILAGLRSFMQTILDIKRRHKNSDIAKLKFFLADGDDLVVANMGLGPDFATSIEASWDELRHFDHDSPEFRLAGVLEPIWYLAGDDYSRYEGTYDMKVADGEEASTIIVASEHLTEDHASWKRIPFQHVAYFKRSGDACSIGMQRLELA